MSHARIEFHATVEGNRIAEPVLVVEVNEQYHTDDEVADALETYAAHLRTNGTLDDLVEALHRMWKD